MPISDSASPDWEARAAALRASPLHDSSAAPASPDWEAQAAALRASPLRDSSAGGSPPQQQPSRMEPPPPPPQEPLKICGDKLKVHFYGVADKDWNLGPSRASASSTA